MKKYFCYFFITIVLLFGIKINAACNQKTEEDAFNVKAYFKFNQITDINDSNPPIEIKIENITDNIYIKVFESLDDTTKEYDYSDTDLGRLTINFYYVYKSIDYKINIYSTDETCTESLKEINLSTPIYNEYSDYKICEDNNYKYCKTFVEEDLTQKEIKDKIIVYNERKEKGTFGLIIDFLSNYYLYVIIPMIIVSTYFIIKLIIIKRRKKQ